MALVPGAAASTDPALIEEQGTHIDAPELRLFVMALFFIFGGITSLNDVIIPKLKELFTLDYMQAMLVQSAFFAAYFAISIPGAALVKRLGYMRGAVVGLLTMMAGCLLFIPASASAATSSEKRRGWSTSRGGSPRVSGQSFFTSTCEPGASISRAPVRRATRPR